MIADEIKSQLKADEAKKLSELSQVFDGIHYKEAFHLIAEYVGITIVHNLDGGYLLAREVAETMDYEIMHVFHRCQIIADRERELHESGKHKEKEQ
jgi:predicted nucleic-acid-binding protein